jgi:hypothetical protein
MCPCPSRWRREVIAIRKVVNPRTTAEIPVKGFNLAAFGNPLSKSAYMEMMWEISNLRPANIVKVALCALDGYEQWLHYFHQIPGRNPLQE